MERRFLQNRTEDSVGENKEEGSLRETKEQNDDDIRKEDEQKTPLPHLDWNSRETNEKAVEDGKKEKLGDSYKAKGVHPTSSESKTENMRLKKIKVCSYFMLEYFVIKSS